MYLFMLQGIERTLETSLLSFSVSAVFFPRRFYLGKAPCMMVADLDMIKQITVKEFDSFVNRVVS